MGDAICDAVSYEGFICERPMGHVTTHQGDDVIWSESGEESTVCRAVTDEPGPLPSTCNRTRDHEGAHVSTGSSGRVLCEWVDE